MSQRGRKEAKKIMIGLKDFQGEVTFARENKTEKGGTQTYFIHVEERFMVEDVEKVFKHSYMAKRFWSGKQKQPKILEVGKTYEFTGAILKTSSYQNEESKEWIQQTFLQLDKVSV